MASALNAEKVTTNGVLISRIDERLARDSRKPLVLLLGAVRHCRAYDVHGQVFPATYVDEADFAKVLPGLGFDAAQTVVEVASAPDWIDQGFDSICCAWAIKGA